MMFGLAMHAIARLACLAFLFGLALPVVASPANPAAAAGPVGTWQWVHGKTGSTSVVRVDVTNGVLTGTLLKVEHPSTNFIARNGNPPVCVACRGKRRDRPLSGMRIVWGLRKTGSQWMNGHGLDPSNGKIYKVRLHTADHGQTLKVRVYIGVPLFGRTLLWHRVVK